MIVGKLYWQMKFMKGNGIVDDLFPDYTSDNVLQLMKQL